MVTALWVEQFGDREDRDDEKKNDANESGNESNATTAAIGFKFVTNLVPSGM